MEISLHRHSRQLALLGTFACVAGGCYSGAPARTSSAFDPDGATDGGGADSDGDADSGSDDSGETGDDPAASCLDEPLVGASRMRRLTRNEYDNTVRDLFGIDDRIAMRTFPADEKSGGFASNDVASVSETALDAYFSAAEEIAVQAAGGLAERVDCDLATPGCPGELVADLGLHAFRRPLSDEENAEYLSLYQDAHDQWDDEAAGRILVQAMLLSPNFLYHVEAMAEGASEDEESIVDDYALASRLSYLVWQSKPDAELLSLAESGELADPEVRASQATRMLADQRSESAIEAFQRDWLQAEAIGDLTKDAELFPAWNADLAASIEAEIRDFATAVIIDGDAKLETMLTANWTVADASVAALYGVDDGPEFDSVSAVIDLDPQTRAGILTQVAFLTSTAHAAEPSWVYRGKFVRENLFCDHLPAPPPGVEVNDPNDPGRLENPSCSSCHLLIDPIGWTFDEYDALGGFRALDPDGQPYDTQGEVVGKDVGAFDGPVDLAHRLAESQDVADCYAEQWMKFANRRDVGSDDACVLDVVRESFSDSGHDIRKLIIAIATTEAFRYRRPAALEEEEE